MAVRNPPTDHILQPLCSSGLQELLSRSHFVTTRDFLQAMHAAPHNAVACLHQAAREAASESLLDLAIAYLHYQLRIGAAVDQQAMMELFGEQERPCVESVLASTLQNFQKNYCPIRAELGAFPCQVDQFVITQELKRIDDWVIYRAKDLSSEEREVQFELCLSNLTPTVDYESAWNSFAATQERMQELSHPHVVPSLGFGLFGQRGYVITPLSAPATLADFCRVPPVLGAETSVRMILQVLDGLCACHSVAAYHCGIKPSSVSVVDEHVFLHSVGRKQELKTPEPNVSTVQADCYAVGCVLYELLTGARPEQGSDRKPLAPSTLWGLGDPELDLIVQKSVEWHHSRRFKSAKLFRDSLERWIHSRV